MELSGVAGGLQRAAGGHGPSTATRAPGDASVNVRPHTGGRAGPGRCSPGPVWFSRPHTRAAGRAREDGRSRRSASPHPRSRHPSRARQPASEEQGRAGRTHPGPPPLSPTRPVTRRVP
ncbi:hypothetical protein D9753_03520 [Streptomyces dangxiongensis]|uniref:Uncharacterized protein n=1 Tax=Streptomyces dangxiongensis TaxID=1442032 RepID=A0A3G2J7C5_9ACTN|nr:hypothetical protein D9753_03520 [Streptomyces dangxiongensis]